MATDVYEEAAVDVVGPSTVVSEPIVIKVCTIISDFNHF